MSYFYKTFHYNFEYNFLGMSKYVTAAEAVKVVKSNDRVYVQAAAATPSGWSACGLL